MADTIEVLAPGTRVYLSAHGQGRDGGIEAVVTAVQVWEDGQRYLCSWYASGQRYEEYVLRDEIVICGDERPVRIGFACGLEIQSKDGQLTSHRREVGR